ncbi:hypothetical protein EZJ19_14690 [Parasulfuritortus cantonensis]|uniref:Glycosyltransferase n=1 Tax=Parasulfuritortus cantonensis TaxID=2528202 RepID=A0A4R1B2I4_9PROT|nr:hypothetical protein [Parasulfuritortus cantonensis]TCJ11660.1 hypothetical protein EZJ19_14690 [Parasulfuritortus cantonensis]
MTGTRLLLLPAGDRNTASSRIRVYQLHEALLRLGIASRIGLDGLDGPADVLFVQKRLNADRLAAVAAARAAGTRIVYDVDDLGGALRYWAPEALFEAMLARADHVTTASAEQGEWLAHAYGIRHWSAIANSIDYAPGPPVLPAPRAGDPLRVVWFGNDGNFRLMVPHLATLLGMAGVQPVAVVAGRELGKLRKAHPAVEFHAWTLAGFVPLLQTCDLAVLAHDGDADDRRKGNNRMVTAIHYGVPAVVSDTPEYARSAARLGVAEAVFGDPAGLRRAVAGLRRPAARLAYLRRAQPAAWAAYSPEVAARQFLRVFLGDPDTTPIHAPEG